jgi:hypothetical protein
MKTAIQTADNNSRGRQRNEQVINVLDLATLEMKTKKRLPAMNTDDHIGLMKL